MRARDIRESIGVDAAAVNYLDPEVSTIEERLSQLAIDPSEASAG